MAERTDDPGVVLARERLDAVVFDLDGVLTFTATLHAQAWKALFDPLLQAHGQGPFDLERDYRAHVDGKPRLDGIRALLAARGIALPEGDAADADDAATIRALARRKNALFLEALERQGVTVDPAAIVLLKALRDAGVRTALATSSRNGAAVLHAAGAQALFDVVLDGNDAAARGLAGKPAPDLFLAAAQALGAAPARAAVFEDALPGVAAGRAGGFALVVGVDRAGRAEALRQHGAHVVVADLRDCVLLYAPYRPPPSALERADEIAQRLRGRRLALFLDYDGTLTPIVDRPQDAHLAEAMRATVARLARRCTVAVVSGRDRADVQQRVAVAEAVYAGSHGFDISGPGGWSHALPQAEPAVPALDRAQQALQSSLAGIAGALLERKRFALAVHYRLVDPTEVPRVERCVDAALRPLAGLRKKHGKKVFELQPDLAWDKGAAVRWLLRTLELDHAAVLPMFLGDDLTDEDAFRALGLRGLGIVVLDTPRETAAAYTLRDTDEVQRFLETLATQLESGT